MDTLLMPSTSPTQSLPSTSAELGLMLLGPSARMSQLWVQIRRLAPYARTVLLAGGPDSGQEAVARLLLDLSPWPQRSFVRLVDAEAEDRLSRPTALNNFPNEALLYLPDVDRLSSTAQAGLLRLMRARRSRAFSVVATTSEDLRALVGVGQFSMELSEALNSLRVAVPSLGDRIEDLPMLLSQSISMRCQAAERSAPVLTEEILRAAMQYAWPGNLWEVGAVADHLLSHSGPGQELRAEDLQRAIRETQGGKKNTPVVRLVKLDTVLQEHICAVLRACHGNKLRAAEILGISRSTLYRMIEASEQAAALSLAS